MRIAKIETIVTGNRCPNCKRINDVQTSADGELVIPRPGDLAICFGCQCILVYDEQLHTVNPTAEQIALFKEDIELWNLVHKCRYYLKED